MERLVNWWMKLTASKLMEKSTVVYTIGNGFTAVRNFFVRPGSLRHIVLGSYLLAVVPMMILLFNGKDTIEAISSRSTAEIDYAVTAARLTTNLTNMAYEIERLLRQSAITDSPQMRDMAAAQMLQFEQQLNSLCRELEVSDVCPQLAVRMVRIGDDSAMQDSLWHDAQFADLHRSLWELQQQVDRQLLQRNVRNQRLAMELQQRQTWTILIVALLSSLLILYATNLITRPVAKLKQIIKQVTDHHPALPAVSKTGPVELITLEKEMHALADRLSNLEQLRSIMLRHASHELKTPLSSIKEGCSLLSEQVVGPLNSSQQEVVNLLTTSSTRLALLIEQLLDYNRLLQQAQPEWKLVESKALIEQCLADNALAINQQEAEISIDSEPKYILVDPALFRRILDNLLSNALAYGARSRPIDIKLNLVADRVQLDVANRGQKIPHVLQASLFEPFRRGNSKRNDNVTGSGLGLSIVADCARMMHGTVSIVAVDYADVCFRVLLPVDGANE